MNKVFAIGWCLLLAVTDTAQAETNVVNKSGNKR
jgi:hypothetical protein